MEGCQTGAGAFELVGAVPFVVRGLHRRAQGDLRMRARFIVTTFIIDTDETSQLIINKARVS